MGFHFVPCSHFPSGKMKDVTTSDRNYKLLQGEILNHPHESSQQNLGDLFHNPIKTQGVRMVECLSNHGEVVEFKGLSTSSCVDQQVGFLPADEVAVCVAQQWQEAEGTHQWVPSSLGSLCLLSTGRLGHQHNGVAGPLCLILMSYHSSPHYPCYWLVWSQPGALGSNNKQSSFFLFLPLIAPTPTRTERNQENFFSFPESPTPLRSWFIDQSHVNKTEILKPWTAQSHRLSWSFSYLVAELVLQQSNH